MNDRFTLNSILKISFCLLFFQWVGIMTPAVIFATPPSKIILEYDQEKKILHMEFKHVSSNPRKHYLRRVFVYKNDVEAIKRDYTTQTNPQELIEDVSIELKPGDVIRVLAICSKAGRKEETLIIPEAHEESSSP